MFNHPTFDQPMFDKPVRKRNPTTMAEVIRAVKGGQARAKKLSPERRREIAQQAAKKRWTKT